jgi:transposase
LVCGKCGSKILAQVVYAGTANAALFELWFERILLPEVPDGFTIILDNAAIHRKQKLLEIIGEKPINLLFLPPYSPGFNPIEKFFANLKNFFSSHLHLFATFSDAFSYYFRFT